MGTSGGRPPYVHQERVQGQFEADGGTPTKVTVNNVCGWKFPAGVDSAITTWIALPLGWGIYSINLVWVNLSAATGNVRWRTQVKNLSIGLDSITEAPERDVLSTPAAQPQNQLTVFAGLLNQVAANGAFFGSEYTLRLIREGSTDGVAGDFLVPFVSITRNG